MNGQNGVSVTSTALGIGNPNCPHGGSSFTSSSGTTFACNGADGGAGGGGLPLGSEIRTQQSSLFTDGGGHILGSISLASRSLVTFTGGLTVIAAQDPLDNNLPITVRCSLEYASNGTGIGAPVNAGLSGSGSIPITLQGIAEGGAVQVRCIRVSQAGSYIAFPGNLTAIQIGP